MLTCRSMLFKCIIAYLTIVDFFSLTLLMLIAVGYEPTVKQTQCVTVKSDLTIGLDTHEPSSGGKNAPIRQPMGPCANKIIYYTKSLINHLYCVSRICVNI